MNTPEQKNDSAVRAIVELKRQLIDLKLDALLGAYGTKPTTSVHDLDAIVDEVVAGVEERRRARLTITDDQTDCAPTIRGREELRTSSLP